MCSLGHNPMCSKVTNKLLASICRLNQTSPVLDGMISWLIITNQCFVETKNKNKNGFSYRFDIKL